MSERLSSFGEFWPFYLSQHAHPTNRALHLFGTALGGLCWAAAYAQGSWRWFVAGPLVGYACAWLGHLVFERNRPATFTYPVYSLLGDVLMLLCFLVGVLDQQVQRHVRRGGGPDA